MADENEDRVIFSIANNQENNSYWGVYLGRKNHGEGRAVIGARNGGLEADYSNDAANRIDDGNWHFVVGVFEAADSRQLYVDGQLQAASSPSVDFDGNTNSWSIGRWCDSSPESYFQGDIDHVRIWNRALTASEVIYLNTDPAYSTDLMGYWDMNEDSGTKVFDNSQYSNTGELENSDGSNSWVSGHSENALLLDGNNDYVEIPDDDSLDGVNKMSIEFWVNPDNLDGRPRGIISKRSSWGWQQAYSVFFWSGNRLYVDIDGTDNRFSYDGDFENDKWYYIVVTYDGEADWAERVKVYVDGELKKTAGENSSSITNYSSNLYLGTLNQNYRYYMGGKLDEVKIHNSVLSAAAIQNNYADEPEGDSSNLVSYWDFNTDEGDIAYDKTENNNNGEIEHPKWRTGILGSCLYYNGNNDQVIVEREGNPELDPVENLSVVAWVKNTSLDHNYMSNIIGRAGGSAGYAYLLYMNDGRTHDNLGIEIRTGNGSQNFEFLWPEKNKEWFQFGMTFTNDNNGTLKMYWNGQMIQQWTGVGQNLVYRNQYADDDVFIGSGYSWTNNFFKGNIDEIGLWNVTLSADYINSLYNNGNPMVPNPGGSGEARYKIVYWSE
jgi:hypothetical protein